MRRSVSVLIAVAGWLLALVARALPTDPGVAVVVEPIPAQVTLARAIGPDGLPLVTYAAYRVTLSNTTTNDLNRVFYNATAANVGSSEALRFDSALPAGIACSGLGTARLECSLGSLVPGSSASFYVVVVAPGSGTRIDVSWVAGGFEGNGGGNGCCSQTGTASTALVDPTTDESFLTQVVSFVKPSGGTLFTGVEAVSTPADGWTTLVRVPAFAVLPQTTAAVVETALAGSCQPYALAGGCFASSLSIPGQFAALEIVLRWDKAFFSLGGTKPADVKLFYSGSNGAITYPTQLALCSADAATYGSAPSPGRPCFAEAPKKLGKQDTANKALWGDLEFRVLALDNGVYNN